VTQETAAAIERLERSGIVREFERALRLDVAYSIEIARAAQPRRRRSRELTDGQQLAIAS